MSTPTGSRSQINRRQLITGSAALGMAALLAGCTSTTGAKGTGSSSGAGSHDPLEIFSFLTSGGDALALAALYKVFDETYPGHKVINDAIGGGAGAGGNEQTVLTTRMLAGDPPDSFQVHVGANLIDTYVTSNLMEPLDDLYKEEGYDKLFPPELIKVASYKGKPYSVPIDMLRANVLWYSKPLLARVGATPPTTWTEFFQLADQLQKIGVPAFGMAEASPGETALVFETIMITQLGANGYRGLFNGKTKWSDPRVTKSLQILKKIFNYVNSDYLSFQRGDIPSLISSEKAAMIVQSDFVDGYLKAEKYTDYGWVEVPGSNGVYDLDSDSFGLPKKAKHPQVALDWLKTCGSKKGQDAFNPIKGSISPRKDRDTTHYDAYQKWSAQEFDKGKIVPSIYNGSALNATFVTDFDNILSTMSSTQDVSKVQDQLVQALQQDTGI